MLLASFRFWLCRSTVSLANPGKTTSQKGKVLDIVAWYLSMTAGYSDTLYRHVRQGVSTVVLPFYRCLCDVE